MHYKWNLTFRNLIFTSLVLLFGSIAAEASHPIYILLTHPRATGTAFEKVMRTHKDITVLHAPFFYPYIIKKYGLNHPFTQALPDTSVTFESVRNHLFALAENGPVFFKESGYLLIDFLRNNPDFYKNPQIKIAFLVRDPARSIISFYRKMPTVDESIIGHRQLWELFELLKNELPVTPLIVDSDEFLKHPIPILNKLGEAWNLQFNETNLHWESGYADDWHLKNWYVEVGASTELKSLPRDIPKQSDGTPEYSEVTNEHDRQRIQNFYRSQNVYYQLLLENALKI